MRQLFLLFSLTLLCLFVNGQVEEGEFTKSSVTIGVNGGLFYPIRSPKTIEISKSTVGSAFSVSAMRTIPLEQMEFGLALSHFTLSETLESAPEATLSTYSIVQDKRVLYIQPAYYLLTRKKKVTLKYGVKIGVLLSSLQDTKGTSNSHDPATGTTTSVEIDEENGKLDARKADLAFGWGLAIDFTPKFGLQLLHSMSASGSRITARKTTYNHDVQFGFYFSFRDGEK